MTSRTAVTAIRMIRMASLAPEARETKSGDYIVYIRGVSGDDIMHKCIASAAAIIAQLGTHAIAQASNARSPDQRPGAACFACLLIILPLGQVMKEPTLADCLELEFGLGLILEGLKRIRGPRRSAGDRSGP